MLFEPGRKTIRGELIRLLIISLSIGIVMHIAVDYCGNDLANYYLENSDYLEEHEHKYIGALQEYVNDKELKGTDQDELYEWADKHNDIIIQIYDQDYGIAFVSYNAGSRIYRTSVSKELMDQMNEHTIHFKDGDYRAYLFGAYVYRPYNYSFVVAIASSILTFLLIFLLGIRRKMKYIAKLKNEVEILGGGDLNYEISIEGNDELAELAEHLDQMRMELRHHMDEESRLQKEHRFVISQLSHDIRTPLTTIMLYSDLLMQKRYRDETQHNHLIYRIHSSAEHMGKLTDKLSAHVKDKVLQESDNRTGDMMQALSEMAEQLRMQDYKVEESYNHSYRDLFVGNEELSRIMDNVLSNILKYADRAAPVTINVTAGDPGGVVIAIGNGTKRDGANIDGETKNSGERTGIGLVSIRTMVEAQGGSTYIERSEERFVLKLIFPAGNF